MQKFTARTFFVLFACLSLSMQSCISRLRRPEITGVIVDYDKKPVANCKVGEALTDKNGKFTLPEMRYNAFLLTEIFAMEAPPLMVFEPVEKEGFEKDAISIFHSRGGGQSKGAKSVMDTIFLRKINQQFDIPTLLKNSDWKLAFTKHADTIYLVKNGFREWCKTDRCSPFYGEYEGLVDNAYTGAKNLPEGMIRRMIDVRFDAEKSPFKINMICEYKSTFEGPNRPPDTLNTSGTWQATNQTMKLSIVKMAEISGSFKISDVDLFQMKLTRLK